MAHIPFSRSLYEICEGGLSGLWHPKFLVTIIFPGEGGVQQE